MGALKDLLDPETGERICSQVAPDSVPKVKKEGRKKRAYLSVTKLYHSLWPATWQHFLVPFVLISVLMSLEDSKLEPLNKHLWGFAERVLCLSDAVACSVRILVTSFTLASIIFISSAFIRRFILRFLLAYKGWLYLAPKAESRLVFLWALLVKFVTGRNPRCFSYQNCLPRMPVPPLKVTVKKLLDSLKPVLEPEEYKTMEKDAKVFLKELGYFPQLALRLKSWWSPNYVSDWWEKYVYLMSRSPLPICSNYYILDYKVWNPTSKQSARAAGFVTMVMIFQEKLEAGTLEPLVIRDTIPLCMDQYKRCFSTARIPGVEIDEYVTNRQSKHFCISINGIFYKLSVVDAKGKRVNTLDLQDQFEWMIRDAEDKSRKCTEAELRVAALTGAKRTDWANIRNKYFSSGINKESIKDIEESICFIAFDEHEISDLTERANLAMHSNGASNMWFDKSFQAVIYKNGRLSLNFEHGWADAPVPTHVAEYAQALEQNYRVYDEKGNCKPFWANGILTEHEKFYRSKALITPKRLEWEMSDGLEQAITEAHLLCVKNSLDLDLRFEVFDTFGKGAIKAGGVSPDAFIQMAFQLAYYKDSGGRFALTYEATITRFFRNGRTETVRSLTSEVREFVLAMNDENVSTKEKIRLLKVAAEKHQRNYRDCMAGKGIDRHLFALYVVCKAKGYDTSFLSKAFAMPWTLSTSHTPINTLPNGLFPHVPEAADTVTPGGGFGPVSDEGYGIAYSSPNEDILQFHISSKRSCADTDSRRMIRNVFSALCRMRSLFNEVSK